MTTIPIPSSVAEILRKTTAPTRLVDEQGNVLGSFSPVRLAADEVTPEELAEMKRRMMAPGPRATTEQMLEYLDSREKK